MRRKVKKVILEKSIKKKMVIMAGVPLGVGTMVYLGGKFPGAMGTTITGAGAPAVPMVGAVVGISALGIGIDVMKKSFKIPKLKKRRVLKRDFN